MNHFLNGLHATTYLMFFALGWAASPACLVYYDRYKDWKWRHDEPKRIAQYREWSRQSWWVDGPMPDQPAVFMDGTKEFPKYTNDPHGSGKLMQGKDLE